MSAPAKFRKKPVVIEAMQLNMDTAGSIIRWSGAEAVNVEEDRWHGAPADAMLAIHTREGTMFAGHGDWVICGVKGEFYPCKPDIFDATYEPAEPPRA